ncbi:MAG: hypothetical protein RR718_05345 [Comamonas sp.]
MGALPRAAIRQGLQVMPTAASANKNELPALGAYGFQRQKPLKSNHIQRKQLTLCRPSCHQKQQAASRLQDQMG